MLMLILARVLHGLGGGGLSSMGMIVLGDLVAPKERGRYYTYFALTYTTAGASGPALGGFIADHLHWSVIFWINLPMGLAALGLTASLLRRLPRYERPHRLDFIGAALIVSASVSFMLALNLGGVRHPWTSLPMLALFAGALVMGVLFVLRLLTAPEPLIPIAILTDPHRPLRHFGQHPWLGLDHRPQYHAPDLSAECRRTVAHQRGPEPDRVHDVHELERGARRPGAGPGRSATSVLPMIGLAVSTGAVMTLAWLADRMTLLTFELLVVVIGVGFGPLPSLTSVALQNVVARHQLGISIGTMNFSRNLYTTMLIAVFGAIVLPGGPTGAEPGAGSRDLCPRVPGGGGEPGGGARRGHPDGREAAADRCRAADRRLTLVYQQYVLTYDRANHGPTAERPA